MLEFIISMPVWIGCSITIGFTSVSGLLVYLVAYRIITKYKAEDLKDPAISLFRVVAVLVSLMLSLAFRDVIIEMEKIRYEIGNIGSNRIFFEWALW